MYCERTGIAFLGAPSVPEMARLARRAEELGFESIWVAETRISRDGFVPLAAIAAATSKVRVGTAIVNVYTRGPVLMAVSFATLEEMAPGRVVVGLGTGSPLVLAQQGVEFVKPLTRLREYLQVLRRLLAGEPVTFEGETIRVNRARLEVAPARSVPVYLGVTGPRALQLAGETADGVFLNGFTSIDYVGRSIPRIAAGAERSGRSMQDLEIAIMLVVSVDSDGDRARDRVRPLIATYLSGFPNIARESGLDEQTLERIRADGARAVTDEIVDRLAVAGTPEHCRQRIEAYRAAGAQLPILAPVDNWDAAIEALAR